MLLVVTKRDLEAREGQVSQLARNVDQKKVEIDEAEELNRDLKTKLRLLLVV